MPANNLRTESASEDPSPALRPKERQIYEAAARIFYEKGYSATTNQNVADAVGMLKGSLYYYIDTKEDLLYGVIKMAYDSLSDHLAKSRSLVADDLERLRYFIVGHTTLVVHNLIPVAVLERDLRSLSEARRREVVEWRDSYEAFLRGLLRAGQASGLIRSSIDTQMTSILIFSQMHAIHSWYSPTGRRKADEVAEVIADHVINGVRAPA